MTLNTDAFIEDLIETDLRDYDHVGGVAIKALGAFVASTKLTPPSDPLQLAEYHAE